MRIQRLVLPALALGAAALLAGPAPDAVGFGTLGFSLSTQQRDVRVFNNFADATANDNTAVDPQFPGYDGAEVACWKGAVEWGSELHGTGDGDPVQPAGLGSGVANFDASFQGNASSVEGLSNNVMSSVSGCSGGVLAFAEGAGALGWRIRFCEDVLYDDGPGADIGGAFDLQGVACHEYGHALGLAHSTDPTATMFPSASGAGLPSRSINQDDSAGVQSIYGVKASDKPHVGAVVLSSGVVTLVGSGFTICQVWFTQKGSASDGTPIKVLDVPSTSLGTRLSVALPAEAGPGDVLVKNAGAAHQTLSNAVPFDAQKSVPNGGVPQIASVSPPSLGPIAVDGPAVVTLTGANLGSATAVRVAGLPLASFTTTGASQLFFEMPLLDQLATVPVEVENAFGLGASSIAVVASVPPVVDVLGSDPAFLISFNGATVRVASKPGDLFFLAISPDLVPSSLPGAVDLGIGKGFSSLLVLFNTLIPAKGFVEVVFPFGGIPSGTKIFWQGAVLDLAKGVLPLVPTNVQATTVFI